jgi:hypothetical protein
MTSVWITKVLDKYDVHVVALIADGGASCQTALKPFNLARNIGYTIFPFSDYDHLVKTTRNHLHAGEISINGVKLEWSMIVKEWENSSEVQKWIKTVVVHLKSQTATRLSKKTCFW